MTTSQIRYLIRCEDQQCGWRTDWEPERATVVTLAKAHAIASSHRVAVYVAGLSDDAAAAEAQAVRDELAG